MLKHRLLSQSSSAYGEPTDINRRRPVHDDTSNRCLGSLIRTLDGWEAQVFALARVNSAEGPWSLVGQKAIPE